MKRVVLAAMLVACKADLHHTVDALPADSTTDTLIPSTGEPPPNAVTLTITRGGVAEIGVPVLFQGGDSSVVLSQLTDDNGRAWALAPAGGFVTALEHRGAGLENLFTFAAVQPGDALVLALDPTGPLTDVNIMLTVPAQNGAVGYHVYTPCGDVPMEAASASIRLSGCPTMIDLVVVPYDVNGDPQGSIYAPDISLATGSATVSGTYQALTATDLAFTNVPSFVNYLGVYDAVSATAPAFADNVGASTTAGAASMTTHMPVTAAAELTATSLFPTSGQVGQQLIYHWHPAATSYALDVGSVLLPAYLSTPIFDVTTHALTWTTMPGGSTPDVVRADLHIYRDDIPAGRAWDWHIVAPNSGTSITLPKLSVVDFDFNVAAGDAVSVQDVTTVSLPGGFAGFHIHGFANVRDAISGTLGRIVVESLYFESL